MKLWEQIKDSIPVKLLHLDRSTKQDWGDAGYWLGSIIIGGLMPVWLPFLFLLLYQQKPTLWNFTQNGELAIFSASLLSASFYVVTKHTRWNVLAARLSAQREVPRGWQSFPLQRLFMFVILGLTVFGAVMFLAALLSEFPEVTLSLDTILLHQTSIYLCLFSLVFSFLVTVIDNAYTSKPDIPGLRDESFQTFLSKFDRLEDGGQNG